MNSTEMDFDTICSIQDEAIRNKYGEKEISRFSSENEDKEREVLSESIKEDTIDEEQKQRLKIADHGVAEDEDGKLFQYKYNYGNIERSVTTNKRVLKNRYTVRCQGCDGIISTKDKTSRAFHDKPYCYSCWDRLRLRKTQIKETITFGYFYYEHRIARNRDITNRALEDYARRTQVNDGQLSTNHRTGKKVQN